MYKLLATAALALGASAQNMMNLTQLLSSENSLSGLSALLQQYPDLAQTVASAKNVTLFAPNNQAIQQLQSSGMLSSLSESDIGNILMYHVVPDVLYSSQVNSTPAFVNTDLTNSSYTNVTDGQVVGIAALDNNVLVESGLKSEAQVVQADLNYTNGVVHIIDSVLTVPLNISTTAVAADLSAFAGALIGTNLLSTLDGLSDVTIFAPSNAAFVSIGSAAAGLSSQQLTSILEYHVINGTIAYAPSLGNGSVASLEGTNLNITVVDGAVFVNAARVINSDILVSGGVMHVIDSVLNPNSTASANPDSNTAAVQYSSASSASLAFTSSVPTASSTISALTATTNDVASGYSTVTGGAVGTGAGGRPTGGSGGSGSGSSSSSGIAALPTGMVGAAALFGGAAMLANF